MSESASVVVDRPLSVIESHLWTVTNWAACLQDVVSVRRVSHERYLVELLAGRDVHEVLAAVRWNARHHRFAWKGLDGPPWTGTLRLAPVNGRRTRLDLEVLAVPRTFLGGVAELVGARHRDIGKDLARIHGLIMDLPQASRPGRLQVDAEVPELDVDALAGAGIPAPAGFGSPRPDTVRLEAAFG